MTKKHKPEYVIGKLLETEIVLTQGGTAADARRRCFRKSPHGERKDWRPWKITPSPTGGPANGWS